MLGSPTMGRVLRPLLHLATAITFYTTFRQFWSAEYAVRYSPDAAYVTLLAAYAGHREVRRWSQDPALAEERARRGELFVAAWWLFYFAALVAANHVSRYRLPESLYPLCLQVTGIFFGTLTSQQLFERKEIQTEKALGGAEAIEEKLLGAFTRSGKPLSRRELETQTGLSRSSLQRALSRLQLAGRLRWTGASLRDPQGRFELA